MPKPVIFAEYSDFIGINNLQDTRNIKPQELVKAINVDISEGGRIVTRNSPRVLLNGNFDSLFLSKNQGILCRLDNNLIHLHNNLQDYDIIFSNTSSPFVFAEYDNRIIASNKNEIGFIINHSYIPFEPTTEKNRVITPPVSMLDIYHGRLYGSKKNTLYISDPLKFNQVQVPNGFIQFKSEITNIASTDTGIYISTTNELYFIYGNKPEDFTLITLGSIKVLPNGMAKVPSNYFGVENIVTESLLYQQHTQSNIIIMFTTGGILAGLNNGKYINITNGRYGNLRYKKSTTIVGNKKIINIT